MAKARAQPLTIADLSPANFAIVMATGILGVASHQQGHRGLSRVLLAAAVAAWAVVAALTVARLVRHPQRLLADLRSHQRAPGLLAAVAGTGVLGSLWLQLGLRSDVAGLLDALAVVLWLGLTYAVLMALVLEREKPLLADGVHGAWLLVVVATQSVAALTVVLAGDAAPTARLAMNFAALALWLCGGMVYVWLISLIVYRSLFFRFAPGDFAPTSWINMGAMAISTLVGALLVAHAPGAPVLGDLLPVLKGGTVLFWAVGTWWIPLLVGLSLWRYLRRRDPLRYEVGSWGAVFPLGMYSAATHAMGAALDLPFLEPVAAAFFVVALAAWVLTVFGLLRQVGGSLMPASRG